MPAHPVGHRDQAHAIVDEEVVLVALPDPPDVGDTPGDEVDRAHRTTSATVWPNCTRSPRRSRVTSPICLPFTNVPLVEPRSSTKLSPLRWKRRACSWETY